MRAIVLAYHDIGCTGIEALLEHGFDIAGVLTHADDPHETAWFRSVAELAARHGLPVFAPKDPNHPLWVRKIRELAPDVLFSFYYRAMLSDEVLAIPKHGSFNLHGSLLPAYRGRAPANWAILNGETETGVTLHHMVSRPDAGDIVGQRRVPITPADDARTLNLKLADAARELLGQTLPLIRSGTAPRIPQDESAASYYGRRTPADGVIDWRKPASDIVNLVRAVTRPYPGAFTYTRAAKVLVWQAEALKKAIRGASPGQVFSVSPFEVACGDGAVRILFGQARARRLLRRRAARERPQHRRGCAARAGAAGAAHGSAQDARPDPRRQRLHRPPPDRTASSTTTDWEVYGMDMQRQLDQAAREVRDFHFFEGDITINSEWIEYHVKKCDVVLPLVAIATPATYVSEPLRVFELDFEENLPIVRYCVKYGKRADLPVDLRGLRHVPRRGVRRGHVAARLGPDQQAALDLLLLQAADGPRDLGLRPAGGARLHAVPAVQLDRPAARHDRLRARKAARA